jgi:hypothetical protein
MNRVPLLIAGLALGVAAIGGVSAQETPAETIANGGYSVADPTSPIVADEGEVQIYGDIETGNSFGEAVGDPAGLASIQSREEIRASVAPPDFTDDDPGLVPGPALAPTDGTTTTAPAPTGEGVPIAGEAAPVTGEVAPTTGEAAPAPDSGTTAAPAYCDSYGTWYDAQVAYESAGGVNADAGLVQAADPDYDGVACEHLITY